MKMLKRMTALFLCLLMLSSLAPISAFAEDDVPGDEDVVESTACTVCNQDPCTCEPTVTCEENTVTIQTIDEITGSPMEIPDCDCGYVGDGGLDAHADGCGRKGFCKDMSGESAEYLAGIWKELPADIQVFILTYLSWIDQAKRAELKALIDTPADDNDEVVLEESTDSGNTVVVSGDLPEGTQLEVKDVADVDFGQFDIADDGYVMAVLDISLQDANGVDYQPSADEKTVLVTVDAAKMGLSDGSLVRVHHLHGDKVTVIEPIVIVGGKLMFPTDSFSIILVEFLGEKEGTKISANSIRIMTVGDEQVFYCDENNALWTVDNEELAIFCTTQGISDKPYSLPWIKVRAEKAGTAKIIVEEGMGAGNRSITITVVEKSGFHIKNKVVDKGCLVPMWSDGGAPAGVYYDWTRSDNLEIKPQAINVDGSINVSKDHGGVTNGKGPITYTVTAKDADGKVVGTDSYKITYGNEILNPSFETPADTQRCWFLPNGFPGLYWQTTSPGAKYYYGYKGQDIEFAREITNPYWIGEAADGKQFVELNAYSFGALYQDILTTAGADLDWSFSHTSRCDETNTMYVVVAATKDAQNIVNLDNVKALLKAAGIEGEASKNDEIPSGNSGKEGYSFEYEGGTYRIWTDTSDSSARTVEQWNKVSGTYKVPEEQYLTRLFFVSDPYSTAYGENSYAMGNIIDGVYAGEHMSCRVEYHKAELQSDHTEIYNNAAAYHALPLANLGEYAEYEGAHKILVNGKPYPGTLEDLRETGLYITNYGEKSAGQTEDILLQIYFQDADIIVNQEIVFEGWETLSEEEKTALIGNGINITFELSVDGKKVTETTLTITGVNSNGKLIAQCAFDKDKVGNYFNRNFIVKAKNTPTFEGYELESFTQEEPFTLKNEAGKRIKVLEFVNVYSPARIETFDLKITKTGWDDTDENQTFIFRVTDPNNFSLDVTIVGDGSAIIKDLPTGTYTVTELTDWSWRYVPMKNKDGTKTIEKEQTVVGEGGKITEVTFANDRTNKSWLSGDSYCENWWGGTNDSVVRRNEDNDIITD